MEIRYFTEVYSKEYGSIFRPADYRAMGIAENMDNYRVTDANEVLSYMTDFRDDNGYRAFEDSLKKADTIIIFMKDGLYPGDVSCVYEMILN